MEAVIPSTPRIRVLPSALADQIAAGEVVERPASAVKELLENAVDAGARRVDVEVEAGGRRLLRVVDDGCGMTPEETRLALQRHATSKIRSAEDLWGLETFGFRGEALPSIAAVSRLTVRTKMRGAPSGFRLVVEAGVETDAGEVGLADGTQIEVRDLFFNTPARQKFLKSEQTESANVSEAVLRMALAHPEVHFRLRSNGRMALELPPQRNMGERVRAALARRGAGALHEASGQEGGHVVRAYLASPEAASSTARSTFLFVGRRFVRDRSLLHALSLGYGELLEKGRYPLAALFLDVPGQDLDVNVHPQKLEVRFARAQEVYAAVRHVVADAVARAPWLTAEAERSYSVPPRRARQGAASDLTPESASLWAVPDRGGRASEARDEAPIEHQPIGEPPRTLLPYGNSVDRLTPTAASEAFFSTLEYIGQLHRTYLVCERNGELILVDQHAAHERVAFERLRAAHEQGTVASQRLLFPIPLELDEETGAAASRPESQRILAELGFEMEPFGPTTLILRAVPELLKDADAKPLLQDLLHRLAEGGSSEIGQDGVQSHIEDRLENVLATMACHSVVRAGDALGPEQAVALLAELDQVQRRSHCPHGRPVLWRVPLSEIERRFGRT